MIMEIYLNKEKAEQEGYDVRTLYYAIDQFFKDEGVPKIGHGKYGGGDDQNTFTVFGLACSGLPKTSWFLKIVDKWYIKEFNDMHRGSDCLESYYRFFNEDGSIK